MRILNPRIWKLTLALLMLPDCFAAAEEIAHNSGPLALNGSGAGIVNTTRGSITFVGGMKLDFSAEAGVVAIHGQEPNNAPLGGQVNSASGGPIALMSYVAYFAKMYDHSKRPILFLWDGGPSISSRTLVVDSFGPVRVEVPGPGQRSVGSSAIESNPDCLLDTADLVFIDAPGTGFGRIVGREAAEAFYGIDGDAAAFTHFIERFLISHGREGSPLFLFGHSYGTMRAPVVAHLLLDDEFPPLGIVSVSQWLNNDDNVSAVAANPGTDNAYIDALPSYAATAWYYHRLPGSPPQLRPLLDQAEAFATGDYAAALLAGSSLSIAQEQAVAAKLERFTSIPASIWQESNLRIDGGHFRRIISGNPYEVVARLDSRYTGYLADPLASADDADPFGAAIGPPLAKAGDIYERDLLGFGRNAAFSPDAAIPDLQWNEFHSADGRPWDTFYNVIPDLAAVMNSPAGTRILIINGYYDLGTTYFGAIEDTRHLPIRTALRQNISIALLPTGHEPYLQNDMRHSMHDMIARFISSKTSSVVP